jgi:hypothetical protein
VLATDPVDFEEMAAEQNRCPETQRLLGGTSLKLAFHRQFSPHSSPQIEKKLFFTIFTMSLTPGG